MKGRLPGGAEYSVRYLAGVRRWVGQLTTGGVLFEGDAAGEFQLLHELDDKFREWQRAQVPAAAPTPG